MDDHSGLTRATEDSIVEDYDSIIGIIAFKYYTYFDSDTRVFYLDEPFNKPIAYTTCSSLAEYGGGSGINRWCKPHMLHYNSDYAGGWCFTTGYCRRWIACHELGHTFGLQHRGGDGPSGTCMSYDETADILKPHEIEHLEDCYPRHPIGDPPDCLEPG